MAEGKESGFGDVVLAESEVNQVDSDNVNMEISNSDELNASEMENDDVEKSDDKGLMAMMAARMRQMKHDNQQLSDNIMELKDDNKELRDELQGALVRGLNEVQTSVMQYTDKQCEALNDTLRGEIKESRDALKEEIKDSCEELKNDIDLCNE